MGLADADAIAFQPANPKRQKTAAWQRYEDYKVASTVEMARSLGATTQDLLHDIGKGFAFIARNPEKSPLKRQRGDSEETFADHPKTSAENEEAVLASLQEASEETRTQATSKTAFQDALGCKLPMNDKEDSHAAAVGQYIAHEAARVAIQRLQQDLLAARATIVDLRAELQTKKGIVLDLKAKLAEVGARESSLNSAPSQAGESSLNSSHTQAKNSSLGSSRALARVQVDPHGPGAAESLALKACAAVEAKVPVEERSRIQAVATWVKWLVAHIPGGSSLCRVYSVRVLAAVVLHAAWGLELGEGLPLTRTLEYAVACSWRVLKDGPRAQVLVMKFLGLTAGDCVQSKAVYSKMIGMLWATGPIGLPEAAI